MVSRASELELGERRDFDSHPDSEFFLSLLVLEISFFQIKIILIVSSRCAFIFSSLQGRIAILGVSNSQTIFNPGFKEDEYVPPGRIKVKLYSIA